MDQALYRKYRPKSLTQVIGQEPITKTLASAIETGKISHAYLFTGPRGVGKTTVARILAHEVNQLPYSDESIHLDIIEIDGASNRRIEEVRDLREKVHTAPSSAKYKVYIIDEVHMLTREAFNALLKTLEEPPAHCIFILATTEVHKLPETIISRTQHFTFRPIDDRKTVDHLKELSKKEKINIEPEALELLAEFGNGSFRDSINLLDQLSSGEKTITPDAVSELAGLPPKELTKELLESINHARVEPALNVLQSLQNQGIAPANIASALSKQLRSILLSADKSDKGWIPSLLKNLLQVSASKQPQDVLDIMILEAASRTTILNTQTKSEEIKKITPVKKDDFFNDTNTLAPKQPKTVAVEATNTEPAKKSRKHGSDAIFDLSRWDELLQLIKQQAGPLYTALRLAKPVFEDDVLNLYFEFALHQKKVSDSKNIALIEESIKKLSGTSVVIRPVIDKTEKKPAIEPVRDDSTQTNNDENLKTISNIFGQTEMLES